uniref:Uncharacterized protein n=1 Tax=Strongyloides venezuelensis TaxID=75913 RepID=A0A0K0G5A5_STRVS
MKLRESKIKLKIKKTLLNFFYVYQKLKVDSFVKNITNIENYDPNISDQCSFIKNYTDIVFGLYVKALTKTFSILTQTTIPSTSLSQTSKYSCQTEFLVTNEFLLDNCNKILTTRNITELYKTSFYGPDCLKRKLNSSEIFPNLKKSIKKFYRGGVFFNQ